VVPGFNINVTVTLTPATDRVPAFLIVCSCWTNPHSAFSFASLRLLENIVGSLRFAVGAFLPTETVPGVLRELG
jgi:hypothetical protein